MIYKVVFGFEGKGQGWSETHAMKNGSDNPQVAILAAIQVAEKRVTFLGREFSINAIRCSLYSDDAGTQRMRGIAPSDIGWTNPVQTQVQAAEPAVVALKMVGNTNAQFSAVFKANTNRTYCGAPPDDAVDNGGVVIPGKAGLGANTGQWIAVMLQNQFGWLASNRISDNEISTITQLGSGHVEMVTLGNIGGGVAINSLYKARIRGVNEGRSPLNGEVIVRVTGVGTVVTQEIIGLALAQSGGSIRLYAKIQPFVQYANIVMSGRTAKHKRGRPFGSLPGRAPKRMRG